MFGLGQPYGKQAKNLLDFSSLVSVVKLTSFNNFYSWNLKRQK